MNRLTHRLWGVVLLIPLLAFFVGCVRTANEDVVSTPSATDATPLPTLPVNTDPTPTVALPQGPEVTPVTTTTVDITPTIPSGVVVEEGGGIVVETTPPAVTPAAGGEIPTGGGQSVTIQAGDTLYGLALQYGVSIEDIVAANNLTSADDLDIGQVLVIPAPGFAETVTPAAGESGSTGEQVHIVRAGETLYSIGRLYGVTIEELQTYNGLTNVNDLDIGQEIKIPPSQ
jgi:LysM repeat protein